MGKARTDGVGKTTLSERRIRTASIAGACAALALFFATIPSIDVPKEMPKQPKPFVEIIDHNPDAAIGMDEIFDDSPLFIPTRWNAAAPESKLPAPASWKLAPPGSDALGGEVLSSGFLRGGQNAIERARIGLLHSIMRHVFSGFGRENVAYKVPENAEAGSLEVIDTRTGSKVYTGGIPKEIAGGMLSIAEFFVDIEDDGWALRPLIRETSGDEKTDEELSKILRSGILRNLPRGKYKAVFSP